jgi:hypothetical protein
LAFFSIATFYESRVIQFVLHIESRKKSFDCKQPVDLPYSDSIKFLHG